MISSGSESAGAGAAGSPLFSFALDRARAIVDAIPEDRRIVLLGESTHGTEEYYRVRAEVTRRLVEERGFRAVCFEADWPYMQAANDFVHGRRATPFPAEERFPTWMWRNEVTVQLFEALKRLPPALTPDLFGLDCYSLFESKRAVIAFLEKHDAEFAAEVKSRLAIFDKYDSGFAYADAMVNGNLSRVSGHITECLTRIQARLQWGSDKFECSDLERLSAEQNCEVVIAADEYYRKCISEPRGSQASWNARDQHMATTLLRIQNRLKDPKVIVWAHNSHVGDSTATKRGGVSFEANETWNLGQMTRATFGHDKCWIVGQYTHRGTVTAAPDWGRPHADVPLKPALPESFEGQLHELLARHGGAGAGAGDLWSIVTAPFSGRSAGGAPAAHPLKPGLVSLLSGPPRLQRWVGVSYKPETELQSHYGEMNVAACYDQIVFADVTSALAPVAQRPQPRGDGGAFVSRASTQRLIKEFQRIQRAPPPGIEARPLESDLLEWHFALRPTQAPYSGGEYHGRLNFPPEYPLQPPSFRILTPSGRFEPGARLCLSMSDFHPESWNPSWSVETLLVGLQSFMLEESDAIGSVRASAAERQRLAAASREFNAKNPIFRELFLSGGGGGGGGSGGSGSAAGAPSALEAAEASVCRFCFSSDGELISPCMCRGSNEWLHLECLRAWQKTVVLTQPTHPKYQTDIDTICNVCLEPFSGAGIPRSRHEQILEYVGGAEIARLVAPGNLLVSTRESSRENLELMGQHPEIRERLSTWTKAVFLMLHCPAGERGGLLAVSMSKPVPAPPGDVKLDRVEAQRWDALRAAPSPALPYLRVRHWDGGPLERKSPIAVAHVPAAAGEPAWLQRCGIKRVPPAWVYGTFEAVSEAAREAARAAGAGGVTTINCIWGYGGWGGTQILAEIGRGGWGLVPSGDYVALRPDPSLEFSFELDFAWERTVGIAKLPPRTEYTRSKRR